MGLNWTTFLVEIVNFVVLVWLLTRFLYRPVTQAIAARQKSIADRMQQAADLKARADALEKQYQDRLVDWEREKAALRSRADDELAALRASREEQLAAELTRKRAQEDAAATLREAERARELEKHAAEQAAAFCSALLGRIASPEVETRIVDAALADLAALGPEEKAAIARASGNGAIVAATRYPLDGARRASLTHALAALMGQTPEIRFEERDDLVAGLHIDAGTMVLQADLAEELRWFAERERAGA